MHKIPLFPLNTVLFPKVSIPLHVFEDRYKRMIRHCIDTKSPFGVVLIRMGSEVGDSAIPYDVGTTGNIINVNKIEDGRLFIIAIGDKIFRINKLIEDKSFLQANVDFLIDDEPQDIHKSVLLELRELLKNNYRLASGLKGEFVSNINIPEDLVDLSYFAPPCLLAVENIELQRLLEESSAKRRLAKSITLLKKNETVLKDLVSNKFNFRNSVRN